MNLTKNDFLKKKRNKMEDLSKSEIEDRIESYDNELDLVDDEISANMFRIQSLSIELDAEKQGLAKLQTKRKKIEHKITDWKGKL